MPSTKIHVYNVTDSDQVIEYDDVDAETLDVTRESCRFCAASIVNPTAAVALFSDIVSVLDGTLDLFGNKPYMLHQSQGFPPYETANAFDDEDESLKKIVKVYTACSLPQNANTISSHVHLQS